jgi:hypothetical protein
VDCNAFTAEKEVSLGTTDPGVFHEIVLRWQVL